MMRLDDLQLDKWQGSLEPERNRSGLRVAIVICMLAAIAGGGYYVYWRRAHKPPTDVRVHTEQAVAPSAAKPEAVAGDNIDLPPLEQTDPIVRKLVTELSTHPRVAAWLATDHLIRNFTVVVFNIANGRTPAPQLGRLRPAERFQILEQGGSLVIDPRSYRRYDSYADAVAAADARGTAKLYATLKPRIQDAYRELGYPDGNFDAVLERAIVELLKTPVLEGNVTLASRTVAYEFADPKLQSLPSVQRQFLRMGPRNVRLIQAKLREVAPLLGISVDVH